MNFSNEQLERYSRHIILKEIGVKGQKKLLDAKVLIIGAGGLGAPAAMYLAAAGDATNIVHPNQSPLYEIPICKMGCTLWFASQCNLLPA